METSKPTRIILIYENAIRKQRKPGNQASAEIKKL